MKKLLIILLALLLMIGCLAGCGGAEVAGETSAATEEDAKMNFDFDLSGFSPSIDSVHAVGATIEFSIPDSLFDIEVDSFDSEQFLNDSFENFSDDAVDKLQEMETDEVVEIAKIQLNLLSDLNLIFEEYDLPVTIDEKTGEIAMDSAVLFEVDSDEISADGKALLQKFMQAYTYVVFNDKYEGKISKVIIEGHTDTDGAYDYNVKLSQSRADAVLNYVLSADCGLNSDSIAMLKDTAEAKGMSYDDPVYDANGQVDKVASRRVTFRFLIEID